MTQEKDIHEFADDFRVSAYALGEATPEEAAQIEAMMAENPALRDEIDAIRGFSTLLTETLESEPLPEKTETLSAAENPNRKSRWTLWLTTAALLLVCVTAVLWIPARSHFQIAAKTPALTETPKPSETSEPANAADAAFVEPSKEMEAMPFESDGMTANAYDYDMENSEEAMAEETYDEDNRADGAAVRASTLTFSQAPERAENYRANEKMKRGAASMERGKMEVATEEFVAGEVAMDEAPEVPIVIQPAPKPEPPQKEPLNDKNSYHRWEESRFQTPAEAPFSTFGVDVDTASYTLARQYLTEYGELPNPDAIRVEEFINYFEYDLPQPEANQKCPFTTSVEIQKHPWAAGRYMARVSLKGREIPRDQRPPLNLVFLLDVSGSMSDWNKLPLLKDGMMKLLDQLGEKDYVTIVTYANDSGVKLEPTCGTDRRKIEKAILELNASGGTSGAAGIQTAYQSARKHFNKDGVNRVILCTDGDFNIGMTNNDELEKKIADEAKSGVFLTVLGFGMGNYHDDRMKSLSSKGNGNYGYVDSRDEAKRLLYDDLCGTLITIAKDVKLQVEFNPANVAAYRLIGYENRKLNDEDFHNDKKDSGDIGAGHSVTALYEIIPVGGEIPDSTRVDAPRYQKTEESKVEEKTASEKPVVKTDEWMYVKLRYKLPNEDVSTLQETPVKFTPDKAEAPSANFQFASGVALFAMLLRHSDYVEKATFDTVLELIHPALGDDASRKEFETLVNKAKEL